MSKPRRILFVTGNMGKFAEVSAILRGEGFTVTRVDLPKLEVQADKLEDVVVFAALTAYTMLKPKDILMVEDAGLFIDALRGFPGPYSSYVYKTIGIRGVLKLMEGVTERSATFRSVIAVVRDGQVKVFAGEVRGRISLEPRGTGGFGFDPIFIPEGSKRTFAEMSLEEKNMVSHRGRAVRKMLAWLRATMDKA